MSENLAQNIDVSNPDLNYLKNTIFFKDYQKILDQFETKRSRVVGKLSDLAKRLQIPSNTRIRTSRANILEINSELEEARSLPIIKKIVPRLEKEFCKIQAQVEDDVLTDICDELLEISLDYESTYTNFIKNNACKLLEELEKCPSSDGYAFEVLVEATLDFLFTPLLEKEKRTLLSSDPKTDLKPDLLFYFDKEQQPSIVPPYYEKERGFWDWLFDFQRDNGYLLVECKNVEKLTHNEINQLSGYMNASRHKIGALVYKVCAGDRGARNHRFNIENDSTNMMILLIKEELLKEMLRLRIENKVITGLLKRKAIDDRCFS